MVQADQGSRRPFTRTRWWWIRHAPVRAHGGRIYAKPNTGRGLTIYVELPAEA